MSGRPFVVAALCLVILGLGGLVGFAIKPQPAPPLIEVSTPEAPRATRTTHVTIKVYVTGAVATPGVYALHQGDRVDDAIRAAGGVTADANQNAVNLAAILADGQEVRVPRQGTPLPASSTGTAPPGNSGGMVNINTANVAELRTLPGIGQVTAQKIVDYRTSHGPFQSPDDLLKVPVRKGEYDKIKDRLTV